MKIAIYTLGCKVSQYETQAMERELTARGHELVPFEKQANARRLAVEGYREIVLTGIEIASWGWDLPGRPGLIELVEIDCRRAAALPTPISTCPYSPAATPLWPG